MTGIWAFPPVPRNAAISGHQPSLVADCLECLRQHLRISDVVVEHLDALPSVILMTSARRWWVL